MNIHSLNLEKTYTYLPKGTRIQQERTSSGAKTRNTFLYIQILTAIVVPHSLNIWGILSLTIIYVKYKISWSCNRGAFYDWYRCFNLRNHFFLCASSVTVFMTLVSVCNKGLILTAPLSGSHLLLMWLFFTTLWPAVTYEHWLIWGLLLWVYCDLVTC